MQSGNLQTEDIPPRVTVGTRFRRFSGWQCEAPRCPPRRAQQDAVKDDYGLASMSSLSCLLPASVHSSRWWLTSVFLSASFTSLTVE